MEAFASRCASLEAMNYPQSQSRLWEKMSDPFMSRWRRKAASNMIPLSVLLNETDGLTTELSDLLFATIPSAPWVLRTEQNSPPDAANFLTAGGSGGQDIHRGTKEDPPSVRINITGTPHLRFSLKQSISPVDKAYCVPKNELR